MKFINKQFAEFKSIFVSEDLLKENEEHANIVTASTMINLFWISVLTWIFVQLSIFKIQNEMMNIIFISSIFLLIIPAVLCYVYQGKGKWIKHLLFICFVFMVSIADCLLKYNVTLIMVLPIILAARYYNKNFTISIAVLTTFIFIISSMFSVQIGQQDLNSYNLIIPNGTTITVDGTLRDSITTLNVDESMRLKNIFIHLLFPKILLFNIVAFACVQISQSGKNMIRKQQEITTKGARIETELGLANAIQKNMLPSIFPPFPEHEEIDIYASMIPAKEVGGDFYDMFLIDDDHLAFCVADVSGKGVPASLVMMVSKILIKNVTKIDMTVDKAFTRVNNMLCEGNTTDIFITSWFGILDLRDGKIEFINAGHNPPLLYSKKTKKFTYLKTKPNLVLAGMEDINYTKQEIQIEPGDRLFLYTDGVVESTNFDNELYGENRLQEFLNKNIKLNVKDTVLGVKKDVDNFVSGSEQFDDITMLELVFKKRKGENLKKSKKFKANNEELAKVQRFVTRELKKQKCDAKKINEVNLAVEEVFINIASYAYKGKDGDCLITIEFDGIDKFTFTFEDSGIKFNPLKKENPDISSSAKKRNIGGLGIFLTRKVMNSTTYKYTDGKNVLKLTKKI